MKSVSFRFFSYLKENIGFLSLNTLRTVTHKHFVWHGRSESTFDLAFHAFVLQVSRRIPNKKGVSYFSFSSAVRLAPVAAFQGIEETLWRK